MDVLCVQKGRDIGIQMMPFILLKIENIVTK